MLHGYPVVFVFLLFFLRVKDNRDRTLKLSARATFEEYVIRYINLHHCSKDPICISLYL